MKRGKLQRMISLFRFLLGHVSPLLTMIKATAFRKINSNGYTCLCCLFISFIRCWQE